MMRQRLAYCKRLIARTQYDDALKIILRHPVPEYYPLVMEIAQSPSLSDDVRDQIGATLTQMNTPDAIQTLIDQFMDVLLTNAFVLQHVSKDVLHDERVIEGLLWQLKKRSSKPSRWQLGDIAGMYTARKIQDPRFIAILEQFILTYQDDFNKPHNVYLSLAFIALEHLTSWDHPQAQSIANHWQTHWAQCIDQGLKDEKLIHSRLDISSLNHAYLAHPKVIHALLAKALDPQHRPNIDLITLIFKTLLNNDDIEASLKEQIMQSALSIAYSEPVTHKHHSFIEMLATFEHSSLRNLAVHYLYEPSYTISCIKIFRKNKVFTLDVIQSVITLLESITLEAIDDKGKQRNLANACLDYLLEAKTDNARDSLFRFIKDCGAKIFINHRYKILAKLALYRDEAFSLLADDLYEVDANKRRKLYTYLATLGKRGLPLLIAELNYRMKQTKQLDRDLIKSLGHADFGQAIPVLLDVWSRFQFLTDVVIASLKQIASEDAYEAIMKIEDLSEAL